jgi:HSP20 family protein
VRVTVELPGVSEKDIDLNLDDDLLTIRGEKRFEADRGDKNESYHHVERSYGSFQRSLRLPYAVKADEVRASFEHGVLTITLPKTAQQERSKKIQIHGSAGAGQSIGTGQTSGSTQSTTGSTHPAAATDQPRTGQASGASKEAMADRTNKSAPGSDRPTSTH